MKWSWLRIDENSVPRFITIAIGTLSLYLGVAATIQLFHAIQPADAYSRTDGEVLRVIKHREADEGVVRDLAEVTFRYGINGKQYESSMLTPLCQKCPPEKVVRVLGKRPSQIVSGMRVDVLVLESDPSIAYLGLPERSELTQQFLIVLGLLLLAPAFAAWSFKTWADGSQSV